MHSIILGSRNFQVPGWLRHKKRLPEVGILGWEAGETKIVKEVKAEHYTVYWPLSVFLVIKKSVLCLLVLM